MAINFKSKTYSLQRRIMHSFRDSGLYQIFELTIESFFNILSMMTTNTESHYLLENILELI
jgi:hypothetical protein